MSLLKDLMAGIFLAYEKQSDLSVSRFTKLVFLCDWVSAVKTGEPITDVKWFFNHFGPYVDDVVDVLDEDFEITEGKTVFGNTKRTIKYKGDHVILSEHVKETIDFVLSKTSHLNYTSFIKMVYAQYPVRTSVKYSKLDLVSLAAAYTQQKAQKP